MTFLLKFPWSIVSVVFQSFQENQMGFERLSENLIFKRLTALRKNIQSVVDYSFNYCFWMHAILRKFDDDCKD